MDGIQDRRKTWRLASSLLLAGVAVSVLAGVFHAESHDANDHIASFTAYANSGIWTGVHLGQFVGMALVCAGLVSVWAAADVQRHALAWTARFGALSAAAALALYAALQAVDGVALKQAADAWVAAPEPEKAARFATAEGIRWLEWGMRSYQNFLLGTALMLLGVVVAAVHRVARLIGYLMALSGLAYLAQGWIIGASGFSAANSLPTLVGIVAIAVWTVWLFVSALRMKEKTPAGHLT
ncbi:uncharacterized membrane protein HdeD (DUF308 family) [Pseudarthrobacter defluvii]|uniref:hypothetical protein n=1 Tax=Pseudarthrobacter defluvii TaxID=410837 RepID=UPI00278013E4|nr:hypothetical protein [Pseudarthrobacter defluvii]MDQ0768881.1 uncharacterized membrane protein HdeD (DUF308 family) [Pseudarthrobacter defluvii]